MSFVFCLLSFVFCLLSFVFCLLSFVFRLSPFAFRLSSLPPPAKRTSQNPRRDISGGFGLLCTVQASQALESHPSVFDGVDDSLGAIVHFHLLQNAGYMVFDRLFADEQEFADHLVALALRHEAKHFRFAPRKRIVLAGDELHARLAACSRSGVRAHLIEVSHAAQLVDQLASHLGMNVSMSLHHRTDRIDQRLRLHVLQKIPRRALAQSFEHVALVVMKREDDDLDMRKHVPEPLRCHNPVLDRHIDVHKHDFRLVLIAELQNLNSVAAFPDHFQVLFHVQDALQAFPEKLVIVGNQQFDLALASCCLQVHTLCYSFL
ncbi:hypothetical protein BN871_DB_00040 [Paenibacillus sp. P22]|nr:hypothetical protein BN871_DB_00040 [Paenibacillus sp. P22]